MDFKTFFGDLEKPEIPEQPLQEKGPIRRVRGPENLPATIVKTVTPDDGPKPYRGPSAAAFAQMDTKQLKAALEKWPDLTNRYSK
jgi:hypothetical protein